MSLSKPVSDSRPGQCGVATEASLVQDLGHWFGLVAGLMCIIAIGCRAETVDPETAEWRRQFLVASEPAGAITLTELADRLGITKPEFGSDVAQDETAVEEPTIAGEPTETVVVVGRIFAGDMEPWDIGKAAFLLAELPDEGHGEGHDADNCPFCKRKAARAPTAIVQFTDAAGQVIPIDARKLFAVDKKDVVVVRGRAVPGELSALVISATDMHVRGK